MQAIQFYTLRPSGRRKNKFASIPVTFHEDKSVREIVDEFPLTMALPRLSPDLKADSSGITPTRERNSKLDHRGAMHARKLRRRRSYESRFARWIRIVWFSVTERPPLSIVNYPREREQLVSARSSSVRLFTSRCCNVFHVGVLVNRWQWMWQWW